MRLGCGVWWTALFAVQPAVVGGLATKCCDSRSIGERDADTKPVTYPGPTLNKPVLLGSHHGNDQIPPPQQSAPAAVETADSKGAADAQGAQDNATQEPWTEDAVSPDDSDTDAEFDPADDSALADIDFEGGYGEQEAATGPSGADQDAARKKSRDNQNAPDGWSSEKEADKYATSIGDEGRRSGRANGGSTEKPLAAWRQRMERRYGGGGKPEERPWERPDTRRQ